MSATTYSQTWDLESIFEGGSSSPRLAEHIEAAERDMARLEKTLRETVPPASLAEARAWGATVEECVGVVERLWEAGAFVGCLAAQDVHDERARVLLARFSQIGAGVETLFTLIDSHMLAMPDDVWEALLKEPSLRDDAFALSERRRLAKDRMEPNLEMLAGDLAADGYHAWQLLRDHVAGRVEIPFEKDGEARKLSPGQAANLMEDPDRAVRSAVFEAWEKAWGEAAELCAAALNHLGGFRLNLYRHRGWDDVLKEPLDMNRMSRATLDSMWQAVDEARPRLRRYLAAKARFLGLPALAWYDLEAPLGEGGRKLSYDEAGAFVVRHFGRFHGAMAEFAENALRNRWIEAEDRPGKEEGGFCTSFPLTKESRIFMTFGGTMGGVGTLAHELGHAYHFHVVRDLSPISREYPMNLAETASTFAETIVTDAAIAAAEDADERLFLIDGRLASAASFLMNIRARFLFETRFYEARARGPLSVAELNELMVAAEKEAYADSLELYHPHFWASKGHFYITGVPFYNFPYTFGFLFSQGVYAQARREGEGFAGRYDALLRDTGRATVEDLARRHLDVDLTKPDFWRGAVDQALADLDAYVELAGERAAGR